MFSKKFVVLVAAAFTSVISSGSMVHAALGTNQLTNPSFEIGDYPYGNYGGQRNEADLLPGSTTITGWTVTPGSDVAVIETGNFLGLTPQDGNIFLDVTGFQDAPPYGGVTQTIHTLPGQQYSLSFWLGLDNGSPKLNGPVSLTATAGSTSAIFTNSIATAGNQWQQFSMPFTATDFTTTISLVGQATAGGGDIELDNTSVVAVPEPTNLGVVILGCTAMLRRRARAE